MNREPLRVLILDDEEGLRIPLKKYLEDNFGYKVDVAADGSEALAQIVGAEGRYDVVLIDDVLIPGPDGIEVMQQIKGLYPSIECIVSTGWGSDHRQQALAAGAFRYLTKPFAPEELALVIRAAAQQVRLRTISRTILTERDPDRVLEHIAREACSLVPADRAAIVMADQSGAQPRIYPVADRAGQPWHQPFRERNLLESIIRTGRFMRVSDTFQDSRLESWVSAAGMRSLVALPIPAEGGYRGVLYVFSAESGQFDSWETVAVLQALAEQASLAIANSRAFQRLHALIQVSQTITSNLELDAALDNIMRAALAAFPSAQSGSIHLYDEQTNTLCHRANTKAYSKSALTALHFKPGEGIAGWVFEHGKSATVDDALLDPRYKLIAHPDVPVHRAIICVPLRLREKIIGTLSLVNSDRAGVFCGDDRDLLSTFGEQAAIVIENARLYEETRQREQRLTALDEALRYIRADRELPKLWQEVATQAAQLIDCAVGALFAHRPHLEELELVAGYGLPPKLVGQRIVYAPGLVGQVAQSGEARAIIGCWPEADGEDLFKPYGLKCGAAVPLEQAGVVEAVLFVGDTTDAARLSSANFGILKRFAAQASIEIQVARLMNQGQRMNQHLSILHEVSDYVQTTDDLEQILYAVLTGVTAGYGLGFNRAAIFLLDPAKQILTGRAAIGFREEATAQANWRQHRVVGLESFQVYRALLGQHRRPRTQIEAEISTVQIPIREGPFQYVVNGQKCLLLAPDHFEALPKSFKQVFAPTSPLVVLALISRGHIIGLLVADNKFSLSPITAEDEEMLATFAGTAAVAIENAQLSHDQKVAQDRLQASYEASNALVSSRDPNQVLRDIVERACAAAGAWVRLVLIDEAGRAQEVVTAGADFHVDVDNAIRPNGYSVVVMATGVPAVIEDTERDQDRVNPLMLINGTAAALCLPLALEGERIGVMWFHYRAPRHFSREEINTLQLYVNQAAMAYDAARRIRALEGMRQAAEALAGAGSVAQVLDQIVRGARDVLQADSAAIWSYDDVRDKFIPEWSVASGISAESWDKFRHEEPRAGQTANTVMERGWVPVAEVADARRYPFLGETTRQLLDQIGVQSFQGMALRVGDERLGVLYVNYQRPRAFQEREHDLARTFANHAALALKKARLLEQVSRARDAARVVAKVTALEQLQGTLDLIVRGTQDALSCDCVTLYTYDQERDQLGYPPVMVGVANPDRARRFEKTPGDSFVLVMVHQSERYIAESVEADHYFAGRRFAVEECIRSCIAIPLEVGDRKVGVMFVNYRTFHRFTDDELTNIELFANQAAVAIRNAQLYQAERKRSAQLRIIAQISTSTSTVLDPDVLLSRAVNLIQAGFKVYYVGLYLVDEARAYAVLRAGTGEAGQAMLQDNHRLSCGGNSIVGWSVAHGQARIAPDITKEDIHFQNPHLPDTRTEMALPLLSRGECLGALSVQSTEGGAFSEEDIAVLQTMADQLTVSIENARLYQAEQQRVKELSELNTALKRSQGIIGARTALAWMGMTSAAWRHTIEKHAVVIREQARRLRQDLAKERPTAAHAGVEDRLVIMERLAQQILDKPIAPPLSSEEGIEPVSLSALVGERAKQLWQNDPYRRAHLTLDLRLPEAVVVRASPEWLRRAFDVLVDNAVEAVAQCEKPEITIGTRSANRGLEIFVTDSGPGIPPALVARLGLEHIEKPQDAKGMGMGLLIAQTIAQTYEGALRVGANGPDGATMVIWLPVEE